MVALKDKSEVVQQAAASSLGKIGGPNALAALRSVLRDDAISDTSRVAAAEAIGALAAESALPELEFAANAKSEGLRRAAVGALGAVGNEAAARILLDKLEDPSPYVRDQARLSLERTKAIPSDLSATLGHDSPLVRAQAVEKLASSLDPGAVVLLIES